MDLEKGRQKPFSYCQRHTPDGISYLAHLFITQGNKEEFNNKGSA
jgi:hypothetical protein